MLCLGSGKIYVINIWYVWNIPSFSFYSSEDRNKVKIYFKLRQKAITKWELWQTFISKWGKLYFKVWQKQHLPSGTKFISKWGNFSQVIQKLFQSEEIILQWSRKKYFKVVQKFFQSGENFQSETLIISRWGKGAKWAALSKWSIMFLLMFLFKKEVFYSAQILFIAGISIHFFCLFLKNNWTHPLSRKKIVSFSEISQNWQKYQITEISDERIFHIQ